MTQPAFSLLSTSDTDLLSARASGAPWRLGNPARLDDAGIAALVDGSELVVVRILGVRRQYEELLAPLLAGPAPVVVLGGEQVPDAELMELSTVPMGVATEAHAYLAQGGPENLGQLLPVPLRHRAAHRRGLRAAVRGAGLGRAGPHRPHVERPAGRRPLLPGPPPGREHRVRRVAVHRDRGRRGPGAAGVHLVAAVGRRRAAGDAAHRRRDGRHRAGGRRLPAGHRPGRWGRRRLGRRRARRPRRPGHPGPVPDRGRARRGRPTTTGSRRSTSATRWRSRSSTAG